jgi:hypothetical protein
LLLVLIISRLIWVCFPFAAVEWLQKYTGLTSKHQATLDTKQETILQEEINRLEVDAMTTVEVRMRFLQTMISPY